MTAKYREKAGYPQKDSVEREEHAGVLSADARGAEERSSAGGLLERILERGNLNKANKQVRASKGAPGIDGMTVTDARLWLREHKEKLL